MAKVPNLTFWFFEFQLLERSWSYVVAPLRLSVPKTAWLTGGHGPAGHVGRTRPGLKIFFGSMALLMAAINAMSVSDRHKRR